MPSFLSGEPHRALSAIAALTATCGILLAFPAHADSPAGSRASPRHAISAPEAAPVPCEEVQPRAEAAQARPFPRGPQHHPFRRQKADAARSDHVTSSPAECSADAESA